MKVAVAITHGKRAGPGLRTVSMLASCPLSTLEYLATGTYLFIGVALVVNRWSGTAATRVAPWTSGTGTP